MGGFTSWIRATVVVGGALTVAACSTYPDEPRYSTRPMPTGQGAAYPAQQPGAYPNSNPYPRPSPLLLIRPFSRTHTRTRVRCEA